MNKLSRLAMTAGLLIACSSGLRAQLTGTLTVPSLAYPTLATAITALNTQGVGAGGVMINITAGSPQLAPAGGYLLGSAVLNASTSATRTITINGNNNTVTAYTGTTTDMDGMFIIQGVDYLTINGLNLAESALNTTPTTQMEWGYALVKRNATAPFDGCQNVTIQNCSITLNRSNIASVGIYANTHTATSLAALNLGTAGDAHSNNKIYGNQIQNCYAGIAFGFSSNAYYPDLNNDIGGSSAATGNTIQNFGGSINGQFGIRVEGQTDLKIRYNTINNVSGGGTAGGNSLLSGIYSGNLRGRSTISNNTITLQQGTTGNTANVSCIRDGSVVSVSPNTTTTIDANVLSGSGGGSGNFYGLELLFACDTLHVTNNIFKDINLSTTGSAWMIYQSYFNGTVNITGNSLAGTTAPYFQKPAGASFAFYINVYSAGLATNANFNISGNNVSNVLLSGNTSFYGLYNVPVSPNTGTVNMYNNTVSNITGGTANTYLLTAANNTTNNIYGNTLANVSAAGTLYGIYLLNNTGASVYRNKVTGLAGSAAGAIVYGAYCSSTSGTATLYNNFFTDLTAPSSTGTLGVTGIGALAGTVNAYSNTVVLGKAATLTGGANFSCAGVYAVSPLNLKNNIIYVNAIPAGTGIAACIKRNPASIVAGTAPAATAFSDVNNVCYTNTGAQNYIYVEGISTTAARNGYALSGLTASAANNIVNDAQFNKPCGLYKAFMAANGASASFTEDNIMALTAGAYAPAGSSYAESGGVQITTVTDDYAGVARSNPPDIGALQFAGTIVTNPVSIAYTPLGPVNFCAAAPVLATTITSAGNTINTVAMPRVYYKKKTEANTFGNYPADNAATFNGWKYVSATGTAPAFSFAFDYSKFFTPIAENDTIQYFVVAADNAPTPNVALATAAFTGSYCLTSVQIDPSAGGIAASPAVNWFAVQPRPAFTISASHDTICRNAVRAISVTSPAASYSTYSWSPATNLYTDPAGTIPYTGASLTTVYTKQTVPGMTIYTATASNGTAQCTVSRQDSVVVQPIDVSVTGTRNFCQGDSTKLNAAPGYAYQWYLNNTVIPGATAAAYTVRASGSYRVVVVNTRGCADTSAAQSIIAYPLPTPAVTRSGTVLSTGAYSSYQWLLNGAPISGATGASYTYTTGGGYSVTVTDANGCSGTSAVINVAGSGVAGTGNGPAVSVYPNPARDEVYIKADIPVQASIATMDGRLVLHAAAAGQLSLRSLPAGSYLIRVTDRSGRLLLVERLVRIY